MNSNYKSDSWIDPRVEVCPSPIQGMGIFMKAAIKKGEVVIIWGGEIFTEEDLRTGKTDESTAVEVEEGLYLAAPVGVKITIDDLMNHSCDPNLWMKDAVTLEARRDIKAGEELTADYAMWVGNTRVGDKHYMRFKCNCGSPLCRGYIVEDDWKLLELQERYKGHFSPYLERRMEKLKETPAQQPALV